jgi:hypothetical protein
MSKGWTDERRKRQAERIRAQKPWEKSTGPRSEAGKARSSLNAYKHGYCAGNGELMLEVRKLSRECIKLGLRWNELRERLSKQWAYVAVKKRGETN